MRRVDVSQDNEVKFVHCSSSSCEKHVIPESNVCPSLSVNEKLNREDRWLETVSGPCCNFCSVYRTKHEILYQYILLITIFYLSSLYIFISKYFWWKLLFESGSSIKGWIDAKGERRRSLWSCNKRSKWIACPGGNCWVSTVGGLSMTRKERGGLRVKSEEWRVQGLRTRTRRRRKRGQRRAADDVEVW